MKVVEQAVKDYTLIKSPHYSDKYRSRHIKNWESARDFIFDDNYLIDWGDQQMNLEDILDIMDIDIDWFRKKTRIKYEQERLAPCKQENRSGFRGVTWKSGKYEARARINNKQVYLGRFTDPHEAHRAYIEAKDKHRIQRDLLR